MQLSFTLESGFGIDQAPPDMRCTDCTYARGQNQYTVACCTGISFPAFCIFKVLPTLDSYQHIWYFILEASTAHSLNPYSFEGQGCRHHVYCCLVMTLPSLLSFANGAAGLL